MDNTFLHNHAEFERNLGLKNEHVIVDRKDWANIRAFLRANWDILRGPIDKCLIINNITWYTGTGQYPDGYMTKSMYSKLTEEVYPKDGDQPRSMVGIRESLRKAGAELDKKREMILGPDSTSRIKGREDKSCTTCIKEHDPVRECKECKSHNMWKPKNCDVGEDYIDWRTKNK